MYRRLIWVSSVQKRVPRVLGEASRIRIRTETSSSRRSSSSFLTETYSTTDQQISSDRYKERIFGPVPNLLPIHPRSLGGISTATFATNTTIRARYFSTAPDNAATASTGDKDTGSTASLNASRRRAALRKRRRTKQTAKKKKTKGSSGGKQIQLRRHNAEAFATLFDQIAPSNALIKLDELMIRLQKKTKPDPDSSTDKKQDSATTVLPLVTVLLGMLQSTNPNSTVQITVLEFLLSTTKGSSHKQTKMTHDENESLMEDANAVATLVAARELSLEQAMGWNRFDLEAVSKEPGVMEERQALHATKTDSELQEQARQLAVTLVESLPANNFKSVIRIFEAYVNALTESSDGTPSVSTSAETDESESEQEDLSKTEETNEIARTAATATVPKTKKMRKKAGFRKLRFELQKITGAQLHLVAPDTADFFYMNVGLDFNVIETDTRIPQLEEAWTQARDKFVDVMMDIQEKLLASVEEMDDDEVQVIDDSEYANTGGSDDEHGLISLSPSKKKKDTDKRFSRPAHVVFDAMALHEAAATEEDNGEDLSSSLTAPAQSIVFVDNLPVDMTKEELTELYSRCGKLESVEIFNQRPDLDPGPLKKKARAERRKKQLQTVNSQFRKWQRPRTPIYAMLTFESPEGYRIAVNESLRIFGMMVRKHPVRSIRSSDMTRIFLEGISDNQACVDLEYQLSKQLHPDLFVSLDAGQNNRSIVGSCEINFPSFEAALESYHKLQELGLVNNGDSTCKLNWMRTPKDAEQWWTRKLGFD